MSEHWAEEMDRLGIGTEVDGNLEPLGPEGEPTTVERIRCPHCFTWHTAAGGCSENEERDR